MFWYLLVCFMTPNQGQQCHRLQTPSQEICMLAETTVKNYAVMYGIDAEVSCYNPNQFA